MNTEAPIAILILILSLMSCTPKSESIPVTPIDRAFILHSSPHFKGYFYHGSDADYHYFISKWKYGKNKRFTLPTNQVKLENTFLLESSEQAVDLPKTQESLAGKSEAPPYIILK